MNDAVDTLIRLHDQEFGGKEKGRYRISAKLLKSILGRKRLYEDDITQISRALFERGFVLIDMVDFFVILSAKTFVNYRRVNEECMEVGN